MRRLIAAVVAAGALTGLALAQEPSDPGGTAPSGDTPALPAPDSRLPRDAGGLAARFADTADRLDDAIDAWVGEGAPASGGSARRDVALLALDRQRIVLRLVRARELHRGVLAELPRRLRAELRDEVLAKRELGSIHSVVVQKPKISIGRAQPPGRLLAHYRRAQRRFGVGWPLLAAVNLAETAFNKLRNESVSGARGPMQFMPATWRAYGLGGDVRRPRDAILGAANYLHANGAPGDEARALHAYNPSRAYVRAVSRYARRIRADRRTYYAYWAQQVFLGSKRGYRRVSSFGLR